MQQHLSTRLRRTSQLSTKQQVIGCVQGNIGLHGISQVRKLKHRNTDSNRSTGGNKDYKSKIGRNGEDARLKTLSKGSTEDRAKLTSTQRPYPRRSKTLEEIPDAIFNTTAEDRHDACMMHGMAKVRCNWAILSGTGVPTIS